VNPFVEHILLADDLPEEWQQSEEAMQLRCEVEKESGLEVDAVLLARVFQSLQQRRAAREDADFSRLLAEEFESGTDSIRLLPRAGSRPAVPPIANTAHPRMSVLRWVAAASILLAAVLVGLVVTHSPQPEAQELIAAADPDGFSTNELADGTTVRLSPGSSLMQLVPTDAGGDELTSRYLLDGGAFFTVPKRDTPLYVSTGTATVVVTGTRFTLQHSNRISEVILLDGKVRFFANQDASQRVELSPGQSSRVTGDSFPSEPQAVDLASALEWTGLLIFSATPLEQVAETLSRQYDTLLHVDESMRQLTLSGTFQPDDGLEEILQSVALAVGGRWDLQSDSGSRILVRAE